MGAKLPTEVPKRFQYLVEIETVDENTIRIKDKKSGTVLGTVTQEQLDTASEGLTHPPVEG